MSFESNSNPEIVLPENYHEIFPIIGEFIQQRKSLEETVRDWQENKDNAPLNDTLFQQVDRLRLKFIAIRHYLEKTFKVKVYRDIDEKLSIFGVITENIAELTKLKIQIRPDIYMSDISIAKTSPAASLVSQLTTDFVSKYMPILIAMGITGLSAAAIKKNMERIEMHKIATWTKTNLVNSDIHHILAQNPEIIENLSEKYQTPAGKISLPAREEQSTLPAEKPNSSTSERSPTSSEIDHNVSEKGRFSGYIQEKDHGHSYAFKRISSELIESHPSLDPQTRQKLIQKASNLWNWRGFANLFIKELRQAGSDLIVHRGDTVDYSTTTAAAVVNSLLASAEKTHGVRELVCVNGEGIIQTVASHFKISHPDWKKSDILLYFHEDADGKNLIRQVYVRYNDPETWSNRIPQGFRFRINFDELALPIQQTRKTSYVAGTVLPKPAAPEKPKEKALKDHETIPESVKEDDLIQTELKPVSTSLIAHSSQVARPEKADQPFEISFAAWKNSNTKDDLITWAAKNSLENKIIRFDIIEFSTESIHKILAHVLEGHLEKNNSANFVIKNAQEINMYLKENYRQGTIFTVDLEKFIQWSQELEKNYSKSNQPLQEKSFFTKITNKAKSFFASEKSQQSQPERAEKNNLTVLDEWRKNKVKIPFISGNLSQQIEFATQFVNNLVVFPSPQTLAAKRNTYWYYQVMREKKRFEESIAHLHITKSGIYWSKPDFNYTTLRDPAEVYAEMETPPKISRAS